MLQSIYRPPLYVYVVWQSRIEGQNDVSVGKRLANAVYRHVCHDPESPFERGVDVPVRYRSRVQNGKFDRRIDWNAAQRTAVVVLVNDDMLDTPGWSAAIEDLLQGVEQANAGKNPPPHRVIPVAVSAGAFGLTPKLAALNFMNVSGERSERQKDLLCFRLTHELCRLILDRPASGDSAGIGAAPVRIFLSHARKDGLGIVEELHQWLHRQTQLKTFLDTRDIPYGAKFKDVLKESLKSCECNAMLVIQTDEYSTREWCQFEVLRAKRARLPIVVLNALKQREKRSFPYLGNVPVIHDDCSLVHPFEAVIGTLLREVLRVEFFQKRVAALDQLHTSSQPVIALPHAPELLTLIDLPRPSDVVYPDPPLAGDEEKLVQEFAEGIRLFTPTSMAYR